MIYLEDAELMTFSQTLASLGDVFSYRKEKSYSVNGRLTNYQNFSGASGIIDSADELLKYLSDTEEIFVNGQSLGEAFISSVDFETDTDVRKKRLTISFSVYEKLNLWNLYGDYYGVSGIQNEDIQYLNSLSESFSFQKAPDSVFTFSRTLSLNMTSGIGANPIQTAQNVANIFFDNVLNISDLDLFYPGYTDSGNSQFTESIDAQNLSFSFGDTFEFQSGNPFIQRVSHTIAKSEGVTSITERGQIKSAVKPKNPIIGYESVIDGSFARCSGVLADYNFIPSDCPLKETPLSQNISLNEFLGTVDYDVQYSNDHTISTGCITRFSYRVSSSQTAPTLITEEVEIIGLGSNTYPNNIKYQNARNCFENSLTSSAARIAEIAVPINTECCSGFVPIKFSVTDSQSNGSIRYSRDHSCDPAYKVDDPFSELRVDVAKQGSVPLHTTAKIIGGWEEVIGACRGNSTLAGVDTSIRLSSPETLSFDQFLSGTYPYVEQPETGKCGFISNGSYSFDSESNQFTLDVGYNYVHYKELFDQTIDAN